MKIALLTLFILSFQTGLFPCTIFSISNDENNLVGNNEDYLYTNDHYIKIIPPKADKYGRIVLLNKVYMVFDNIQGGMNDKGLFFDMAGTPQDNIQIIKDSFQKHALGYETLDMFLAKCKNIDDAINYWKSVKWGSQIPSFHMLIVEQTGKSIILEWTNGYMKIIKKQGTFQIITNYLITEPQLPNGGGWDRENIFYRNFKISPMITEENVISLLKLTSQKSETIGTLYSNVYNLKKLTVTLFLRSDDSIIRKFNLLDEFKNSKKEYKINNKLLKMK